MNTDPIDDLRAELMAVEPSPAFAAGVRARVEAGSGAEFRLRFVLAAATVAIAAIGAGAYWLHEGGAVAPAPAPAQAVAQSVPAPAVRPALDPAPTVQPARRARQERAVTAPVTAAANAGPFLEVITNQPEMLRRLWAGIDGGVARAGLPTNEFAEITVAPVVVDAIVVPKIGPAGGGGLMPGARRVVVDESARGDQR
jgi:hypothetical protein